MLYSIKKELILGQAKTNIEEEDSAKDKKKTIEATISAIEKQFGKGSIMRLEEGSTVKNVSSIPTGSIGLDSALGVGEPKSVSGLITTVPLDKSAPPMCTVLLV